MTISLTNIYKLCDHNTQKVHVLNFNKCQTKNNDPTNCLSWANKREYRYLLLHWTPWLRNNNNGLLKKKKKKKVYWKWDKLRTDAKTTEMREGEEEGEEIW